MHEFMLLLYLPIDILIDRLIDHLLQATEMLGAFWEPQHIAPHQSPKNYDNPASLASPASPDASSVPGDEINPRASEPSLAPPALDDI